jgi:putative membrane protein
MSPAARLLVLVVAIFHLAVFVAEAFLWMNPAVHVLAIARLTGETGVPLHDQALILKRLFINQGFYNLFLAAAAVAGLVLIARGSVIAGRTLTVYACLSALGAGIVLFLSTQAAVAALLQALPAAAALALLLRIRNSGAAPAAAP